MKTIDEHDFLFNLAECIKNGYLQFNVVDNKVEVTINHKHFRYP